MARPDLLSDGPLANIVDEARRVAEAAADAGVTLRVTGGVGVALTCDSASSGPFTRSYSDIDVVARAHDRHAVTDLLVEAGYVPDETFNALHGARRLYFWDSGNGRQLDVFLDKVEMCHVIDLRDRLGAPGPALTPADLLLMKLQVVESNAKDVTDIACLLTDQDFSHGSDEGIDLSYIAELAARDWGLWRTITMGAERAASWAADAPALPSRTRIRDQARRFVEALEQVPKTRAWRLRSRVGERRQWYALPEEHS